MVAFSHFPAALAIAAEVYVNLETAVRAAVESDRGVIFDHYNMQIERLDNSAKLELGLLRKSLNLE